MGRFDAVVIGCSVGGLKALQAVLDPLPEDFPLPILVAAHSAPDSGGILPGVLGAHCRLAVAEAKEKKETRPGHVYLAPPNYHLLVENNRTLSLSVDPRVKYSRPSIDVLFLSAAAAFGTRLIGILLTGANSDGAVGLKEIRDEGGVCIVQDPLTAKAKTMPQSALDIGVADHVVALEDIPDVLESFVEKGNG